MDVKLPNGVVVNNIPEGTTKAQLAQKLQANGYDVPSEWLSTPTQAPLMDRIGRQVGLTARYGLEGAGSVFDLAQAPVRGLMNLALPEDRQLQPVSVGGSISDLLGLPQPQNATERVVGDISRAVAGTGGIAGLARAVSPTTSLGKGVAQTLEANAPTQLSSAIGGGGAGGLTREAGGGEFAQMAASLAGGFAGGSLIKPKAIGESVQQKQNAPRDEVITQAQKEGYVVLPSEVGAGKLSRGMETVSGKFKVEELASAKNQQVTNNLTRKYLGLSEETPLTAATFSDLRDVYGQAYNSASQLPAGQVGKFTQKSLGTGKASTKPIIKSGKELVDEIKIAREDSRASWKSFNSGMSQNPTKARKAAIKADKLVAKLEGELDSLAIANNQPDIIKNLNEARRNIAKVHTVEKATNTVNGVVDARAIARQADKKVPITDELKLIGNFAKAFPKVTKTVAEPPNPFSIYDVMGSGVGAATGTPLWLLPAARLVGRYGVLSKPMQQNFVQPQYNPPTIPYAPYGGLLNPKNNNEEDVFQLDPITVTP